MKYIDCHVHTFPDNVAPKALGKLAVISGITPCTKGTVEDTLNFMKERDISSFINLNIATTPHQQTRINDTAAALNERYGDKMISFGSVHPDAPDALSELERIKSLNIKGIKLHPDYQDFMIDDPKLFPIYELCAELDIITVFHAGWDCYSPQLIHCLPLGSAKVAKAFPKLRMILAHVGGLKLWEDVLEHLTGLENVYFDTAMAKTMGCPKELFGKIVDSHPKENVLLGSDCPWEDTKESIKYIEDMGFNDGLTEKIMYGNASALLEI